MRASFLHEHRGKLGPSCQPEAEAEVSMEDVRVELTAEQSSAASDDCCGLFQIQSVQCWLGIWAC